MFALADCNNFFASCERVFRPELNGRPVIVLSNNDGCAVARSNEAKAMGIKMGAPLFKIRDIVDKGHVAVFSSNFSLYGDMSRRVQEVLQKYAPSVEQYSIDEAFLDLRGMRIDDPDAYAKEISAACRTAYLTEGQQYIRLIGKPVNGQGIFSGNRVSFLYPPSREQFLDHLRKEGNDHLICIKSITGKMRRI